MMIRHAIITLPHRSSDVTLRMYDENKSAICSRGGRGDLARTLYRSRSQPNATVAQHCLKLLRDWVLRL